MPYTAQEIFKNWMDPHFKFFVNRAPPENRKFFLMDEGGMNGEYLGACLDYIRWGSSTTVLYEFGTKEMIDFIMHWKNLNSENLIWHEKPLPEGFNLPRIKTKCYRGHTRTIKDGAGRLRCAHSNCYTVLSDSEVVLSLEETLNRLNLEKGVTYCSLVEPCKRPNKLKDSFEEISRDSGICFGHPLSLRQTIHDFDGWYLAWYVQKWYEQMPDGRAPILNN